MFEALAEKFDSLLRKLQGQGRITERNIEDALRDVRLALLEADVNLQVVRDFVEAVKRDALGQEVLRSLTPEQHFLRLVHRELVEALAKEGLVEIETEGRFDPHVHEALLSQPSEVEEGAVLDVLQKGYRLGDRVLRPARVVVAAAKEAEPDGGADE